MGGRATKCLTFVGTYRALVHIENRGKTRRGLISVACEVNGGGYSRTETNFRVYTGRQKHTDQPSRTRGEAPFFLANSSNRSRGVGNFLPRFVEFCIRDNEGAGRPASRPC